MNDRGRQPNGMLQPTITVEVIDEHNRSRLKLTHVPYKTYRLLRKDLLAQLQRAHDGKLSVSRSKRGQGFEWFENWELTAGGEPRLVNEGWM